MRKKSPRYIWLMIQKLQEVTFNMYLLFTISVAKLSIEAPSYQDVIKYAKWYFKMVTHKLCLKFGLKIGT